MKRNTSQREAIRRALLDAGRPLSAVEILDIAKGQLPRLGIATVYRTLKSLNEERVIREVSLPGQPSRWEPEGKAHHHHFLCDSCNKLFEVPGCPVDIGRLLPEGYTLEGHDILLQGQCLNCSPKRRRK